MGANDFESYKYYPALRTRPAEMDGYFNLSDDVKNQLLPIITAGSWPRVEGIEASLDKIRSSVGARPFILDLTRESSYINSSVKELLSTKNNFENWCQFIKKQPAGVIPVVQITGDARLPQLIKQTRILEKTTGKVAFRIQDFRNDTPKVINAMSAMDYIENALVIIDGGYIRETMPATISASISVVNDVRAEIPDAIITLLSTSFPSSVTPFLHPTASDRGSISILERELFEEVGVDAVIYGDHSSIHAKVYAPPTGGRFIARIDYPLYDVWQFERRISGDSTEYINAAKAIIERIPDIADDETWGAGMIRRAAGGNVDGMKTPQRWIAARVNIHITKQLFLSQEIPEDEEDDSEF